MAAWRLAPARSPSPDLLQIEAEAGELSAPLQRGGVVQAPGPCLAGFLVAGLLVCGAPHLHGALVGQQQPANRMASNHLALNTLERFVAQNSTLSPLGF
jgi:hypothetical protein